MGEVVKSIGTESSVAGAVACVAAWAAMLSINCRVIVAAEVYFLLGLIRGVEIGVVFAGIIGEREEWTLLVVLRGGLCRGGFSKVTGDEAIEEVIMFVSAEEGEESEVMGKVCWRRVFGSGIGVKEVV